MQIFLHRKDKEVGEEFQPVVVSFVVESPEELRLLFHITNRADLREAIFTDYGHEYRRDVVASCTNTRNVDSFTLLQEELKRQGIEY